MLLHSDLSTLANVVTTLAMMGRNRHNNTNNNTNNNSSNIENNYNNNNMDNSLNYSGVLMDSSNNSIDTNSQDKEISNNHNNNNSNSNLNNSNIDNSNNDNNVATTTNFDKEDTIARAFNALSRAFHTPSHHVRGGGVWVTGESWGFLGEKNSDLGYNEE